MEKCLITVPVDSVKNDIGLCMNYGLNRFSNVLRAQLEVVLTHDFSTQGIDLSFDDGVGRSRENIVRPDQKKPLA